MGTDDTTTPGNELNCIDFAHCPTAKSETLQSENRVWHSGANRSEWDDAVKIIELSPRCDLSTLTSRYRQDASLNHCRVVDTAVVAVPEVQRLWVTPGSTSERFNPVNDCGVDNRASEMLGCDSRFVPDHIGDLTEKVE